MLDGCLIALEGVDGAGTTTQTTLLTQSLRALKVPVHATRQPSDGPIGSMLRLALTGRLTGPAGAPAWNTMALLFAADRIDHMDTEVEPNLRDGLTVVCDRYDHSSAAYQSITGGGAEAVGWIREINRYARRPDLTFVLDVPVDVAAARRAYRGGGRDLYDDEQTQQALAAFYLELERHFPDDEVEHVDASRPLEEVAADILARVKALRAL
jgi:dTMP kinase